MVRFKHWWYRVCNNGWLIGLLSLFWFVYRTGTKPSRVVYPCQQMARANIGFLGLPALSVVVGKLKNDLRVRGRVVGMVVAVVALMMIVHLVERGWYSLKEGYLVPRALGQGRSRVVWITDDQATDGFAPDSSRVNQAVVDNMLDEAVMAFTGEDTVGDAWRVILPCGSNCGGKKIAIKVNFNNDYGCANGLQCPTYQVVNALLRQLVEEAGISQSNIGLYDTSRSLSQYFTIGVSQRYPDVLLNPQKACVVAENIWGAHFGCWLAEADYLINMPLLRNHASAGATLSLKNHLGSTDTPRNFHDHDGDGVGDFFETNPEENSLIQLNQHPFIRNKTILVVADALYGLKCGGPGDNPDGSCGIKPYPNSLFLGVDPVAVDSVMLDYLEYRGTNFISYKNPRVTYRLVAEAGLGIYATSCNGADCSFDYGGTGIDLVRCTGGSCPRVSPGPGCVPGDVNEDGVVDSSDLRFVLGNYSESLPNGCADQYEDGILNGLDMAEVISS